MKNKLLFLFPFIFFLTTNLSFAGGIWGDVISPIGPFIDDSTITIQSTGDLDALLDLMDEQLKREGGRLLSLKEAESILNKINRSLVFDCKYGWRIAVIDGSGNPLVPEIQVSHLNHRDMEEILNAMDENRPTRPMDTPRVYKGGDPKHRFKIDPSDANKLINDVPSRMQPQRLGRIGPGIYGDWVPLWVQDACECLRNNIKKMGKVPNPKKW